MVWCVLCMCTHCDECAADAQASTRACDVCVVRGRVPVRVACHMHSFG